MTFSLPEQEEVEEEEEEEEEEGLRRHSTCLEDIRTSLRGKASAVYIQ